MKLSIEQKEKVESLLSKMTLDEKIGQMNQESASVVGGFDIPMSELREMIKDGRISREELEELMDNAQRDYHEEDVRAGLVGSVMGNDPKKANEIQRIAIEESRLGIPLIIGFDVIHGLRSVYPTTIAEACSFDDELFEETARMAAKESRAYGIGWNFAPMMDIARDSRWGRICESPGEDSYLASCYAKRKIRGLQNDTSDSGNYVAACAKHYVAYGACEGGIDYNTVTMSTSQLYNVYLPPFRAAMEEGAATVMAAFNDLNGVPCTVNKYLLRDVLKDELKFEGFVVSDANAIRECTIHGVAKDSDDAAIQAANAGMDMDMGSRFYKNQLKNGVESGAVPMSVIDDAVRRILSVKVWLGLFENPYVPEDVIKAYEKGIPEEHILLTRKAAQESIVLLKNENNILPLKKTQKICLVGSLAKNPEEVVGAWAMGWRVRDCISIFDGLKNAGADIAYYPCCGPEGEINTEELASACEDGDVIVAVVGEGKDMSGEATSKADISLPGKQKEMLQKLLKTGKPIVLVLMNGRPLALEWESENIPAILEAWQLGIQMGNGVADVLFGEVNPSGKLSASFPSVNGQCPLYYNHPNTGRPAGASKFTSKYIDAPSDALYPFGYGLSYTSFQYSDLRISNHKEYLDVSFNLKNTGDVLGTEVAQLYMQDVTASLVRPVKELKGYKRITLNPGEEKNVSFSLKKQDMGFFDNMGEYLLEDGLFRIFVGGNSRDTLMEEITVEF